jgi:hypothetical protein
MFSVLNKTCDRAQIPVTKAQHKLLGCSVCKDVGLHEDIQSLINLKKDQTIIAGYLSVRPQSVVRALSLSESTTKSSSKTVVSGALNGKQFHCSQEKVALADSAERV